nr:hypothetical protein [Candidatus Nitrosarchaeum limnium]
MSPRGAPVKYPSPSRSSPESIIPSQLSSYPLTSSDAPGFTVA